MAKSHAECEHYGSDNNLCLIKRRTIYNDTNRCTCGKFTVKSEEPAPAPSKPDRPERVEPKPPVQEEVKSSKPERVEGQKARAKGKGSGSGKGKVLQGKRTTGSKKKKAAPKKKKASKSKKRKKK
jgi:hypothetical protein